MSEHTKRDSRDNHGQRAEIIPVLGWPLRAQILLAILIILVVVFLLVGLPTVSLLITENMSGSLDSTISFWGALFAGFISLTVLFIGAAFAFTAFKVEADAKWRAQKAVKKGVAKGIRQAREEAEGRFAETHEVLQGIVNDKANDYIEYNGSRITKEAADDYVCVKGNGASITREVADDYICAQSNGDRITKEVVEQYAKETLQDEGITRFEKIARQIIEKINTENIDCMVDKRLSSYGLLKRFQICFGRPHRRSGPGLRGNGKR